MPTLKDDPIIILGNFDNFSLKRTFPLQICRQGRSSTISIRDRQSLG